MSNVFVVKIGSYTRRGVFQEHSTRYVEVPGEDKVSIDEVTRLFGERYAGLAVQVTRAEPVETINLKKDKFGEAPSEEVEAPTVPVQAVAAPERVHCIDELKIDLLKPEFKGLYDDARTKLLASQGARDKLYEMVRAYLKSFRQLSGYSAIDIDFNGGVAKVGKITLRPEVTLVDILSLDLNEKKEE